MPANQSSEEESRLFLTSVHLKGFKSIENLKVDLNQRLNILIGKNASGKSNFLECLSQVMMRDSTFKTSYKFAKLEFISSDNSLFVWEKEREIQNINVEKENPQERLGLNEKLYIGNEEVFSNSLNLPSKPHIIYKKRRIMTRGGVRMILNRMGFRIYNPIYIRFNLTDNLEGISTPGTIKIPIQDNDLNFWSELNSLNFLTDLLWQLEISYEQENRRDKINKLLFLKRLKIKDSIKENLKKYSPIQDIRFNENLNIYKDEKIQTIENIKIDFKINNNWMPWSQLSDGTKRLFYMISEITNQEKGLIFVEEPELGIHPHQFRLIMEFLKEQSEDKQIILTTHSPYALNCLNEEELSNILITYFNNKNGTQMRHLTKPQITKAKKYMKEVGFLSDYWMLSDLE